MRSPSTNPIRWFASSLCLVLVAAGAAVGQTATRNLSITGGTGFTGTLGGDLSATVKLQSSNGSQFTFGHLNVLDLDVATVSSGGSGNLFPNSVSLDNTGAALIAIAPTTVGMNIPTTAFGSPVSGQLTVTAGDQRADAMPGVIDNGTSGSDGAWDDPGATGLLNDAAVNGFNVALNSDVNVPATTSGTIAAAFPTNITIPKIVDTSAIDVDLVIKNTSAVAINFAPAQNLSIKNLTLTSTQDSPLTLPTSNFNEAVHPTGHPQLDLSTAGIALAQTTVSGTLVADLMGTVFGSIDLRADISLAGIVDFPVNFDDAIHGDLTGGNVPLIQLNQSLNLPATELPFVFTVLHEPTVDVDFDDVIAELRSGTFGLTLPFSLSQQDVVVNLPTSTFEVSNQFYPVDEDFGLGLHATGAVVLGHLKAELGGQIVLDLAADMTLGADLLAEAFDAAAINVVPEPSSLVLFGIGATGLAILARRTRRLRRA